jgi:hypothetical protein
MERPFFLRVAAHHKNGVVFGIMNHPPAQNDLTTATFSLLDLIVYLARTQITNQHAYLSHHIFISPVL